MKNYKLFELFELIKNSRIVIGNVVKSGEFENWVKDQEMPFSAAKEFVELEKLYEEFISLENEIKDDINES